MKKETRIELRNITKSFNSVKQKGLLAHLIRPQKRKHTILKKFSLIINSGEIVGITGPNGCGKSTLLRIIAGIYDVDSGDININGKIIPLLNLKMSLQWRLTLQDNVYFIGTLFGMRRKDITQKLNKIITFAELANLEKTPIYQFSEGMKARMIFAIALHADADILLLDEVFEVGDASFKEKSKKALLDFAKKGGSVVVVSHDEEILNNCGRVVRLT